jgi:thioredoxin 1
MKVIDITKDNFETEVMQSDKPVLIEFWAVWCGPCRMLAPIIDEIAEEMPDVKVCKLNVDDEPKLASQYEIMSIPTISVIKEGKVTAQAVGVRPKEAIIELLA